MEHPSTIKKTVEVLPTNDFESRLQHANPTTLQKVWGMLQSPMTYVGTLGMVMGGYSLAQVFGNTEMVEQNIKDTIQNPQSLEDIKAVIIALKIFATGVTTLGAATVLGGIDHGKEIASKNNA